MAVSRLTPDDCAALARPDPNLPPPEEEPIAVEELNSGRIARRKLHHEDRQDQEVALWIPDGVKEIRGILVHMHHASQAVRPDFHEFARTQGFAVYCMLVRWTNFHIVLPDQLAKLGAELGHPEVANVPWAAIGGSRNVAALRCYVQLDPNKNRLLCILANGGPGIALDLQDPEQMSLFKGIPIISVTGSDDPVVEGMDWVKKVYPEIRSAGLPWAAAPDWNGDHHCKTYDAVYWPFIMATMSVRYPADAAPSQDVVRLKPFPRDRGWLVGPVNWDDPGHENAVPASDYLGDPKQAVWLPDAYTVAAWRAYVARKPVARVDPECRATRVILRLRNMTPHAICHVRYWDGNRLLGERSKPPYRLATREINAGTHVVFASCTDSSARDQYTKPIIICTGKYVDQQAGDRAAGEAEGTLRL